MNNRVLVVDDEESAIEIVSYALEEAGFEVASVPSVEKAEMLIPEFNPSLIILDLRLPGKSGLDLFRTIKSKTDAPTIVLSAKTDEIDKILALELGADDYVTKPFSPRELVSRVRARLREKRKKQFSRSTNILEAGDFKIDRESYETFFKNVPLRLTNSEFQILVLLAKSPGKVFSRKNILSSLKRSGFKGDERSIDVHIHNIREKIEKRPQRPEYLITVRSHGYKLLDSKRG